MLHLLLERLEAEERGSRQMAVRASQQAASDACMTLRGGRVAGDTGARPPGALALSPQLEHAVQVWKLLLIFMGPRRVLDCVCADAEAKPPGRLDSGPWTYLFYTNTGNQCYHAAYRIQGPL